MTFLTFQTKRVPGRRPEEQNTQASRSSSKLSRILIASKKPQQRLSSPPLTTRFFASVLLSLFPGFGASVQIRSRLHQEECRVHGGRGVRACLLSHKRVSASTDEIITALPTPWADPQQSASHMLSRSKLCTWTQGERDDVMTGVGMIHLRQYRFQLKMLGQYGAVEWCMKMTPQAFFKRISFSIMPDSSPQDEDINCSLSFVLWHPGSTCHPLQPTRDTRVVAIDVAIPAAHGWLTIPSTFSANPGERAQTRANPREPARTRANPRKPAQSNWDTIPDTLEL